MLQLDNLTPYAADRAIVMDKHGEKRWVVAVKATYRIEADGRIDLADEQQPVLYQPVYRGKPGHSSLRYEADLLPAKSATDVLVNGQAHAPAGRRAEVVDVGLRVGPVDKRLRVFGDRRWDERLLAGLVSGPPDRFECLPITYEHAYGGWDATDPDPSNQRLHSANPVGSGFAIRPQHLAGRLLPNVEHPSHLISAWNDRPPPAGLGPIASYWSPRLEWAGTYDQRWMEEKFPLLPDDFDPRHHQCAPADQQVAGCLRGGELVELQNLSASGRLQFVLPKVYLAFTTSFGRRRLEHRATLQTVVIEPDASRLLMVWQSSLACHHLLDQLDETVVIEKAYA